MEPLRFSLAPDMLSLWERDVSTSLNMMKQGMGFSLEEWYEYGVVVAGKGQSFMEKWWHTNWLTPHRESVRRKVSLSNSIAGIFWEH